MDRAAQPGRDPTSGTYRGSARERIFLGLAGGDGRTVQHSAVGADETTHGRIRSRASAGAGIPLVSRCTVPHYHERLRTLPTGSASRVLMRSRIAHLSRLPLSRHALWTSRGTLMSDSTTIPARRGKAAYVA